MDINYVYKKYDLTIRSLNVCLANNLHNIEELKKHYSLHKTFKNLRNCGDRSNKELIGLCKLFDFTHDQSGKEVNFNNISDNLNLNKRNLISKFIQINISSLSVRSQNAMNNILVGELKAKSFLDKILNNNDFDLSKVKNIGSRSIPELTDYINKIRRFIISISDTNDEQELNKINIDFITSESLGGVKVPDIVFDSNNIFTWCDYLFSNKIIFNERETRLLQSVFNIYNDQSDFSLEHISEEFKLSRERIRQLKVGIFNELPNKLNFLQHIPDDLGYIYALNGDDTFIIIDDDSASQINRFCKTSFTKQFITFLLYLFLKGRFSVIGNIEDGLLRKQFTARNRHNWDSFYLVNKQYKLEYNFEELITDIYNRLEEKIEETYTFNFKGYLSNFLLVNSVATVEKVFPFCEALINIELGIFLDRDDNISFTRNTTKQIHEYAFVALEHLAKPSSVEHIHEAVIALFPYLKADANSIRAAMKGIHGFIPIGRNSIFGLKKWENEIDNFKGGTIRNIAYEYLLSCKEPKHIEDISQHIIRFRPKTNQYSIIQNLKLDSSQSFRFFKNSVIGLKSRTYDTKFVPLESKDKMSTRTWDESLLLLSEFVDKNNRFPQCKNSVKEEELVLYRWFRIQRKKLKERILEPDRANVLGIVINKLSNINSNPSVEDNIR